MKHYWINLDRSADRRAFMEAQFKNLGLENIRVKAITPDDLYDVIHDFDKLLAKKKYEKHDLACLLSHFKALNEGFKSGDDYFVIMEDDTYMPFDINYNDLITSFPQDMEVAQLCVSNSGCCYSLYNHYNQSNQFHFKWNYIIPSCGFYIVSKKGAEKLIKQFYKEDIEKYDFYSAIYDLYADVLIYQSTNTYCSAVPYTYTSIEMGTIIHEYNFNELIDHTDKIKKLIKHAVDNNRIPHITKVRELL